MKHFVRYLSLLCAVCLCLGCLIGCKEKGIVTAAYKTVDPKTVESQTVAENDHYKLIWDDTWKTVLMESKTTGQVWGTMPQDYYDSLQKNCDLNMDILSPITIEVIDRKSLSPDWSKAFPTCFEGTSQEFSSDHNGSVSATAVENGIEVTFCFDNFQISVPVRYVLREDSVAVSINTEKIAEGKNYELLDVSLAPFMAAVKNDSENGYVFVPSGNGALMKTTVDVDEAREYSGEVYGTDASRVLETRYFDEERVKMPVFGVKANDDRALFGIVESGEGLVTISAKSGDSVTGYSNVFAKCYVRGCDIIADDYGWQSRVYYRVSDYITDADITVAYYPLSGKDAGYIGMADCYRDYLIKNGLKKTDKAEQSPYAVTVLGNIQMRQLTCGIPYYSTKSMTSFKETEKILKELKLSTGNYPATQLAGFGESGIDIGEICGGFDFASVSGSKKDYQSVIDLGQKNHFIVSTDFEAFLFDQSGSGLTTVTSVAKSAAMSKSKLYNPGVALREYDEDSGEFYLASRAKLPKIIKKLSKRADRLGVDAINVSSLGKITYSDYADVRYFGKKGVAEDAASFMNTLAKRGKAVTADDANAYAAVLSDTVFNIDVTPQYLNCLDEYVPFYQIVFRGYKPMYSEGLNLSGDYKAAVAGALSSGLGLGYTVIGKYDTGYIATPHTNLYSSVYADHKAQIVDTVGEYADFYQAIGDSPITDYAITDGVARTTYENGVVSYTNLTGGSAKSPFGLLDAYSLKFRKGGTR